MAVVRARSAPPYGLIVFAALFVVATVAAVLLYMAYGNTSQQLQTLQQQYNAVAKSNEFQTAQAMRAGEKPDVTSIGAAQVQINGYKTLLTGSTSGNYMETLTKGQAVLRTAGADKTNLVEAMSALSTERDALKRNLEDASRQLAALQQQVNAAKGADTDRVTASQKDIQDVQAQLAQATDATAKANAARDAAVAAGEAKINEMTAQLEQMKRDQVIREDQNNADKAKLNETIAQLRGKRAAEKGDTNVAIGEADGKVIRVNAANGEAWIDLGSDQRIVPGLTFTAYDPRTGVRFGNEELAAGKGSLEVISPGQGGQPSLCRITRTTKGQSIQPGDLISNVVYNTDKNRKSHFVIVGDIDLDGDGTATADERERLINMVSRWGGVVDQAVTTQTDYLVTGTPPQPAALSTGTVGDTAPATQAGSAADQRAKERQQFESAVNEAKQLSIPVLNANRFLSMIGYYSTTVIRR